MTTFRDRHGDPQVVESDALPIYHGKELSDAEQQKLADKVLATTRKENLIPGGKSLTGGKTHSPTVQFRVPLKTRMQLDAKAKAAHTTPSRLARRALEEYLAKHDS